MIQVIRIRDQKVYDTIASAVAIIGTPSNYLAKYIRAQKPTDKFDISLTQMFKEFVKRTKDVFAE